MRALSPPSPDCLVPPNGAAGSETSPRFRPTMPKSSCSQTCIPRFIFFAEHVSNQPIFGGISASDYLILIGKGLAGLQPGRKSRHLGILRCPERPRGRSVDRKTRDRRDARRRSAAWPLSRRASSTNAATVSRVSALTSGADVNSSLDPIADLQGRHRLGQPGGEILGHIFVHVYPGSQRCRPRPGCAFLPALCR